MLRFGNQMNTPPTRLLLLGILSVMTYLSFSSPAKAQLLPMAGILGNAGQQNYEDCILNNMKGVQSDIAAQAILDACHSKFPNINGGAGLPDQSKLGILPNQALNQLNGELLQDEIDYVFSYNNASNVITLTPTAGVWTPDRIYTIELINREHIRYATSIGRDISDDALFSITDNNGDTDNDE